MFLLNSNIEIPPYQRKFVWDKDSVKELIEAFRNNRFIPPITICKTRDRNHVEHNYIVDGQQRLTAIMMYKFNFFYDVKMKNSSAPDYEDWTIDNIINDKEMKSNIQDGITKVIREKANTPYSCLLEASDSLVEDREKLLENSYLGFSYIILEMSSLQKNEEGQEDCSSKDYDEKFLNEQQYYYAKLFNDINSKGEALRPVESRRAYYFITAKYEKLFNLDFDNIDFVRYLAILSEYHKKTEDERNNDLVAKNTANTRKIEEYIIGYIKDMSEGESIRFTLVKELFKDSDYENSEKIKLLREYLNNEYYSFDGAKSIIENDIKLFGLIYLIIFLEKKINMEKFDELKSKLDESIQQKRNNVKIAKSPNSTTNLNDRLKESIKIYEGYLL